MRRKISIVIEETDERKDKAFNVYIEGDTERLGNVSREEYSAAEYWAAAFFGVCISMLEEAGVIETMTSKTDKKDVH